MRARILLAVAGVLALGAYLVVVELGMSAGRIHHGVEVAGLDVGGLTFAEAEDYLAREGRKLEQQPIVFIANGFDCRDIPGRLGWGPQPYDTAAAALEVGRGDLFSAVRERVEAWFGGVRIGWAGKPDPRRVGRFLNYCEDNAAAAGAQIDRPKLRYRLRRAIETWPRRELFKIPLLRPAP